MHYTFLNGRILPFVTHLMKKNQKKVSDTIRNFTTLTGSAPSE